MDVPEITEEIAAIDNPSAAVSNTVVSGDSLWRIAQRHYGDGNRWSVIYELNKEIIGTDPNRLRIGQELKLKVA